MAKDTVDTTKYGEPIKHDIKFKGPLQKRSCTDVPCLLIFLAFLGAWGYVAYYAISHGDITKLIVPTDSQNRKCGVDSQVLDKQFLFFFNLEKCIDPLTPLTGCPTPQVCVTNCPNETFAWDMAKKSNMGVEEIKQKLICQSENDKIRIRTKNDIQKAIDENRCARWYVKSSPILNRCMWEFASNICEYIPSFASNRSPRELERLEDEKSRNKRSALALNSQKQLTETESLPKNLQIYKTQQSQNLEAESGQACKIRKKSDDLIVRHKMEQSNTLLSRVVGNLVAQVTNGTEAAKLGEQIVDDIVHSWHIILIALIFAMCASLIFISLMRWIAAPALWLSIFGVFVALGCGIYYSTVMYKYYKNNPTVPNHNFNFLSRFLNFFQNSDAWLTIAIVLSVIIVIFFLIIIFLRKRIVIAIALVKEGSKAVSSIISTVFFPILPWALFIIAIAYSVAVGLYLASIGHSHFRVLKTNPNEQCSCYGNATSYNEIGVSCDPVVFQDNCYSTSPNVPCIETGCFFDKITHPTMVSWFMGYNFVGFIWIAFFISAMSEMVLAGAFATWYWTIHKSNVPYFVLTRSLFRTIFFHMGTLAFGSLILTICRIIRLILEYIDAKLKKYDNAFTRAILCCMKCFFWCLESFLKFLNQNAYIMCAIHGKNFCSSAKDAFNLLMRNFLRVMALDKVTDFLFFLSKIFLTAAAGVGTYYYIEKYSLDHRLYYNAVPTTIVVIGTFLIASVFFGVYSMAVDTLFLCFLEDCERNDGSEQKPYLMSTSLMRILKKKNELPRRRYR